MKKKISMITKKASIACLAFFVVFLSGCGAGNTSSSNGGTTTTNQVGAQSNSTISNISIQFGEGGKTYIIKVDDNDTARELVRNIGDSGKNLPIYDYDNFQGYEYFQYYDIPSRYKIPSDPQSVTSEKAGEVYYSEPNRVILFYQDAQISGDYTKIGEIEDISGLKEAVEDNSVIEGWGDKLIILNYAN